MHKFKAMLQILTATLVLFAGITLVTQPAYARCDPGLITCKAWCAKYRGGSASCLRTSEGSCLVKYHSYNYCVHDLAELVRQPHSESGSTQGCDGNYYPVPRPRNYQQCMANGVKLMCSTEQTATFCGQKFRRRQTGASGTVRERGADGQYHSIKPSQSYGQCIANGRALHYVAAKTKQYCSSKYRR